MEVVFLRETLCEVEDRLSEEMGRMKGGWNRRFMMES